MSFFQKSKPRRGVKRKFEAKPNKKAAKKVIRSKGDEDDDDDQSIDSELDARDVPDRSDSEGERETGQEKKLRLAKLYLDEIEQEQRARVDRDTGDAIGERLRDDYLEQQGRLRRKLADECVQPSPSDVRMLRCKQLRLSVTCVCISSDSRYVYSGTKCSALIKWSLADMKRIHSVVYKKTAKNAKFQCHSSAVMAVAISTDGKYFVSCEQRSNDIQVWNPQHEDGFQHLHTFRGHRDRVNDLAFRRDSHQLFSGGEDRSVKVWSLDEMAHVETVFGHQCGVQGVDALSRERAVTAGGRDSTVRVWKIVEESQLVFNGHPGASVDAVKLLNEENFVTCGDDGALSMWGNMKKKPLCTIKCAHGPRWVTSIAACLNSDVVASGSHDGHIRVWRVAEGCRALTQLMEIPVAGFVNGLAFTPDGTHLVAAVGQEHKLARWWKIKDAKNAIYVIPILKNR